MVDDTDLILVLPHILDLDPRYRQIRCKVGRPWTMDRPLGSSASEDLFCQHENTTKGQATKPPVSSGAWPWLSGSSELKEL